ncbi:MAG: HesA/MoeB/ThiF family protein [Nitrospiraceae bacterium]|nr:HesA/MoeB/ThiF family protein [Nitrospiraceae bacterium]
MIIRKSGDGLSSRELERYRRQLMLAGFTLEHQKMLKDSTVLVAGVGGVGGTAALYLAVAGIGKLDLVHAGRLTPSNMNRQILMRSSRIGESRVAQAKNAIEAINPDVAVEIHDERLTPVLADTLLSGADAALSGRPNFHERRVLNECCVRKEIPMVEGAMNAMEGYLFTVIPFKTPCLNCLYPEDNPEWEELGFPVLGAVSGVLGCLMALEAIKVLTGFGKPMTSRMLVFDLQGMDFRKLKISRDRDCPVCGHGRPEDSASPPGRPSLAK